MNTNILSYALTGYALYTAIANKSKLDKQLERIVDIETGQNVLSEEVAKITKTTHTLIDESLKVEYTFICGRPTSMKKLSGSLHFTITNTSPDHTFLVRGIMFTPILGTTFCNASTSALFDLYWPAGIFLEPGQSVSRRIAYNDLKLDPTTFSTVYKAIEAKFMKSQNWKELGDKYAQISDGCSADLWILANAPYVDSLHDTIVRRRGVSGTLYWHGGNYLPGKTKQDQGAILSYNKVKEIFE